MKVNQIAEMLNDIFNEITAPLNPDFDPTEPESADNPRRLGALFAENLGNIVELGRTITSSTQWGDNFDKYVAKIIDKVGRTIFVDRPYEADDLGLTREAREYGSVLEKIRVEVGDFVENKSWQLSDPNAPDFSGIFDFDSPAEVTAKYFNQKTTFRLKMCYPRNQMEGAFRSAADMQRFIGTIENRIRVKMEVSREALAYRTEANFIIEKVKANSKVVNLLSLYKDASGDNTITAATALENADFLRFCVRKLKTDKALMRKLSARYNVDGYATFTPESRLKAFALVDFATAMETVLKSNTYHDAFVSIDGYREVPYWQGGGDDDEFEDRSTINAIPASSGAQGQAIVQSGIVFVMQDMDAAMICSEQMPVDVLYNPDGRFYKYWYGHDASYYNDLGENGIVYIIEDET